MERRYPLIEISIEVAERLLEPLRPRALEHLRGGHVNTNYAVRLDDGRRIVLRICTNGQAAFCKEVSLLGALAGSIPVPRLHMSVFSPQIFEHPYIVTEWVAGAPLNDVLSSNPEAASEIGEAVASVLLKIGEHTLPAHPFPPFVEYIQHCLFEQGAVHWLGTDTAARLWVFVQAQSAFLDELFSRENLVHGDFQGDNVLLHEERGRWRIAAVLDWEWAHGGCYLRDLGSLLRYEGETSIAFQRGVETGFSERGAPLPSDWRMAARIWDMAAQCEKLAHPTHRGEVTLRSIRIIERCLQDYAN
jgi:aminoglycoside phosphotransferase (APT) family kinase protein